MSVNESDITSPGFHKTVESVSNKTLSEIEQLVDEGYLISLKSYLELKKRNDQLSTDLIAYRLSFKALHRRCDDLQTQLNNARPDPATYNALQILESKVRALDKELSEMMVNLHEVQDESPERLYDFCWSTLSVIQARVDQMDNDFCITMLQSTNDSQRLGRK